MTSFKRLFLILLFAIFSVAALPVSAQMCTTQFEVITTLRPATFGFPTVWDAQFGDKEEMTEFRSGVPIEGGTVMAVGRTLSKDDYRPKELVLVELNRRGRALTEARHKAKEGEDPLKMMAVGKEFVVMSNIRGGRQEHWVRLSWYDREGKFKREKVIKDPAFSLQGRMLSPAVEGKGFVAVLYGENVNDAKDQNGILMRFTDRGDLVWRRAYRPGIPNELTNLIHVGNANYLATGRIRLDDGRMAAWALKLGFDGAVQWQRTYPRGSYSIFNHATITEAPTSVEGTGFVLSGDTNPYDGGPGAAWVMAIDALGEPQWQRYYRRDDHALSGKWVIWNKEDGRYVLIMNADAVEGGGGHDHVRMLTLSPRGVTIHDEAYFEGIQASAFDYAPGWNKERIVIATIEDDSESKEEDEPEIVVIGLAQDKESEEEEKPPPAKPIHKGWVFVATALDPYKDPCAERPY